MAPQGGSDMRRLLSGLCALALLIGVAAGCTDSGQSGRTGGNPSGDRSPSASPPTSPSDGSLGRAPMSPAPGSPAPESPAPGSTDAAKTPGSPGSGKN